MKNFWVYDPIFLNRDQAMLVTDVPDEVAAGIKFRDFYESTNSYTLGSSVMVETEDRRSGCSVCIRSNP